jgi:hypothetical protein
MSLIVDISLIIIIRVLLHSSFIYLFEDECIFIHSLSFSNHIIDYHHQLND